MLLKSWLRKPISALDITILFRQLATTIHAGIPIVQSLELLAKGQKNILLQNLLLALKKTIETGKPLSESMRAYPEHFDYFCYYLIYIGEQSGTLAIMLKRIAAHQEKMLHFKRTIRRALQYPLAILVVAFLVLMIMLLFVVPRFVEIFANNAQALPVFTLFVIHLSQWLQHNLEWLLIPIVLLWHYRTILWKLPVLRALYQKNGVSQFTQNLSITLRAGVPILDALTMMTVYEYSYPFTQPLQEIAQEIAKGQQLHTAMLKNIFFPELLVQMVKIGEESGTLEEMLEKITELFTADLDHFISNLTQLLEPLIIVVLGVLIGGLVIALYLPIFNLGTLV